MNQINAMRQALEALENLQGLCSEESDFVEQVTIWTPEAIDDLRQAIEQAGKMEPVLVVARHDLEKLLKRPEGDKHIKAFIPPGMGDEVLLYTHPPTAAPQEDERCWKCGEDGGTSCGAAHCGLLEDEFDSAAPDQEVHDALCPALTGGKCSCSSSPATVDKAWSQFCGGIGRGPDAPYPGMIEAFEAHYGQSFTDKDWRNETGIWAAAWGYAVRQENAAPTVPAQAVVNQARLGMIDGLRMAQAIVELYGMKDDVIYRELQKQIDGIERGTNHD
jgi:hypothetical protein